MILPADYAERVYAGVLGKVIGVYLGRPFEGWSYERIQQDLGDIEYYVHDKLNVPLLVTDDDISGTFTFLRALADHDFDANISAEQIGNSWLNYLIEERTILWWGGLGNSTEHTAYLRLKDGIKAPLSGSERLNSKVVAEQIGAQIFIDGWAMVSPGNPDQAAKFAEQAARVSHDGEAVYGAIVLAVMEAMAFVEPDINKLLDIALGYIPTQSVISRLIDDVRSWHAKESDWRATREMLANKYGYDKYGGNCHIVPNHGLIIHSLLHGKDDFSETMKIINTSGWDTDCNSGNVGCLVGIKNGLAGIDAGINKGLDWRGPIADRIYIPTADPTWSVSDCVNESMEIINAGRQLAGQPALVNKAGAQFHFEFAGSQQGFTVTQGEGVLTNCIGKSKLGKHTLRLSASGMARFGSPVFIPSKDIARYFEKRGYALLASPRIYPGQTLSATLIEGDGSPVCLYAVYYGENDVPEIVRTESIAVTDEATITLPIPAQAHPIFEVGIETSGTVHLDSMSWSGEPDFKLTRPKHKGSMWRRAWVNGVDQCTGWTEMFRLIQNKGRGLLIQGNRQWCNYSMSADVMPHLTTASGIAIRVQGMKRYYALLLHRDGELQLIKMKDDETVLARCPYEWHFGKQYELELKAEGHQLTASIDGKQMLEAIDDEFSSGAMALVVEEGRTATNRVIVAPS